ncbi:uncharacterized protein TNCV_1171681 [Trichonephila clavipes]|uniref:Transposase n=1 Tax=Trichonephila clavipes TaxID=2585209 RepID=A0A8X6S1S5_TRICX|nr:uncharacterized protein TNCV_1171681 [Trichonephila clavipes]
MKRDEMCCCCTPPIGQQCKTRFMTSYTFRKSNTSKGSSAKSYLVSPRHSRMLVESFFKNDEGHNVTVNGDRYRAMITDFFIPELNNHDVQELWFQQDGATCHTARATIDLLKDTLGDRLISRFGPVNWPPRSCDLTPLDYFLWGYVKSLVYADKPQTLDHLKNTHSPCYCRYTATNVGKSHRKLDVQIGLHPSQPWQSYARNHI